MRQKQTMLTSFRLQLAQQNLRSCVQRCLKKAHQRQGVAANSTDPNYQPGVSRSAAAQQCSMEKLRHTEAVNTAQGGLSQQREELRQ